MKVTEPNTEPARIAVLGAGYVGEALVARLVEGGHEVVATTTTPDKLARLEALGAEATLYSTGATDDGTFDVDAVIHLAPPPREGSVADEARRLRAHCSSRVRTYLYGSTTGAFGEHGDAWIDEATPPGPLGARGQRRLDTERALADAGLPLRVVRIAGIYGPGRTLLRSMERPSFVLFEGGPPTSRIHVDDLVSLLIGMLAPSAPPLAIACDDEPATTLEVARYTCALVNRAVPEVLDLEAATAVMSEAALEMRMGGRRCRSNVRAEVMGALAHPTYREGVRASLVAEGVIDGLTAPRASP